MNQGEMNVTVRWAAVNDARDLAVIHIASWRDAYPGLLPDEILDGLSVETRRAEWEGWLAEGGDRRHTLLAERSGEPVAFCTLRMPSRDPGEGPEVAEIPALYAHPEAIGAGVGTVLLEVAVERLRGRGFRESILWMLEGNHRAAAFYERRGWRLDGGRRPSQYFPGLVGPTEIRWRREL
jgi:GNAT superfamily N-acetyltransferase